MPTKRPTERQRGLDALRQAVRYKLLCWDALSEAEKLLGQDIEEGRFSNICGHLLVPDDALSLTVKDLSDILNPK